MELFIGGGKLESIDTTASYCISDVIQIRESTGIIPRVSNVCDVGSKQTTGNKLNEERSVTAVPYDNKDATDVELCVKEGSDSDLQQTTQGKGAHVDFHFHNTDSPPILSVLYQSDEGTPLGRKFLLTCGGRAAEYVFECDCDPDCPPRIVVSPLPQPKSSAFSNSDYFIPAIVYMQWCFHERILVCGTDDGGVILRSACESEMQGFGKVNSYIGGTTVKGCISSDGNWLVTAGGDGLVTTHRIKANTFLEKSKVVLDINISCCPTTNTKGNISLSSASAAITNDD